jgi:hypothetical protein
MVVNTSPTDVKKARRLSDTSDPTSLSTRLRLKRDIRLRALISDISRDNSSIKILDLGGSVEYWNRLGLDFLRNCRAHVVVLNHIDAELKATNADNELFTSILGDACDLSEFKNGNFDLVHSNSVIEHVGNWSRMKLFAAEARRVGSSHYIQTPYFWFPIDPHYYRAPMIHWIPRPLQARLITNFSICTVGKISNLDDAYNVLDGTSLLDKKQLQILFPEADISFEVFMGIPKSLIAIHAS